MQGHRCDPRQYADNARKQRPPGSFLAWKYRTDLARLCSLHNVAFLDQCQFDQYAPDDFRDSVHLNGFGGKKFVDRLVEHISSDSKALAAILQTVSEKRNKAVAEASRRRVPRNSSCLPGHPTLNRNVCIWLRLPWWFLRNMDKLSLQSLPFDLGVKLSFQERKPRLFFTHYRLLRLTYFDKWRLVLRCLALAVTLSRMTTARAAMFAARSRSILLPFKEMA